MSFNSFKGKTALVTGAGNGIGRTVTLELVKRGCHVFAIDILPNSLVELKSLASDPALLNTLELDVGGEWSSVRAAVENFIGSSQIQFLVNCAAVIFFETLENTKESSLEKIFNVNFKGLVNITQACLLRTLFKFTFDGDFGAFRITRVITLDESIHTLRPFLRL